VFYLYLSCGDLPSLEFLHQDIQHLRENGDVQRMGLKDMRHFLVDLSLKQIFHCPNRRRRLPEILNRGIGVFLARDSLFHQILDVSRGNS
jgi:hypothetical protein